MVQKHGTWPTKQIDHVNRIRHDNSWTNLREVEPVQNAENSSHSISRNLPPGIAHSLTSGKFVAFAHKRTNGRNKKYHLGTFDNVKDAVDARNEFISKGISDS